MNPSRLCSLFIGVFCWIFAVPSATSQGLWMEVNTQSDYWMFDNHPNLGVGIGKNNWGLQLTSAFGNTPVAFWGLPDSSVPQFFDRSLLTMDVHGKYFLNRGVLDFGTGRWYLGLRAQNQFELSRDEEYFLAYEENFAREAPTPPSFAYCWLGLSHGYQWLLWERLSIDLTMGWSVDVLNLDRNFDLSFWLTARAGYRFIKE
jgi:hypothetical protein